MDLLSDTSKEIEDLQVEIWRTASIEQKINMVVSLTTAATDLAIAGIRHNSPGISIEEERYQLAVRRYGQSTVDSLIHASK